VNHLNNFRRPLLAGSIMALLGLTACGGGDLDALVGGTMSGLPTGQQIVLQNNGADDLTVTQNGDFRFATQLKANASYSVTIKTAPTGVTCKVTNGSGKVSNVGTSVQNIKVSCDTGPSVGGTLTGLQSGYSVILSTNGMALVLTQNGDFRFANSLPNGTTYNVVVAQQPLVGTCQVTNPTGVTATNKLALVGVNCQ
jgi:hypothetical protein